MPTTATMSREEARRFRRDVEPDERLRGAVMKPMAGGRQVEFGSLMQVEEFLKPTTVEELTTLGSGASIHYLDPPTLVSWVRETVGDAGLAAALDAVVGTGRPFGLLVPDMKQTIAERLGQYEEALSEEAERPTEGQAAG